MATKIKLALIGCGGIAHAHWRGIQSHAPDIEVTACVDENEASANAFAEQTGGIPFTSLTEALATGDFDSVDLMLPHDLHEEAALQCFAAGKHVCLEKPMAHTLASAERILAAGEAHDKVFMVAEQAQYWPDVHKVAELIEAGAIGDVLTGHGFFFDPLRPDPANPKPWRYHLDRAGGGISIDGGAHWIRPLRIMLGEIDEVFAATQSHVEHMEGESLAHAIFRFRSGVIGTFQALMKAGRMGPIVDFRVTGTDGELIIERGRGGRLMLYDNEHPDGEVVMSDVVTGKMNSYGGELHDFSQAILHGTDLAAAPRFAMGEFRTAQAMYRSVESGTWARVWD
jgi:predicted dehydrogenase